MGFVLEMVPARVLLIGWWMRSGLLLPPEVAGLVSLDVQNADQSLGVDDLDENLRLRPMVGVGDGDVLYVSKESLR
jgi:hypothetical protein